MGFFKNLFSNQPKTKPTNIEKTSKRKLPPLPNVPSKIENENDNSLDELYKHLYEEIQIAENRYNDNLKDFLDTFDTNPLLTVLKNDTQTIFTNIYNLVLSVDPYIKLLIMNEETLPPASDYLYLFNDTDAYLKENEYRNNSKSTIYDVLERQAKIFNQLSDSIQKNLLNLYGTTYAFLFLEKEIRKFDTETMKFTTETTPSYLFQKYNFQNVVDIYQRYQFDFLEYDPIFKLIKEYTVKGETLIDIDDDKQALEEFNKFFDSYENFINYSITPMIENYFTIITGFYCSVREFDEYGFIEMFNYNCLGNVMNLNKILALPVISKIAIERNDLISLNVLKNLNKDIISFMKRILDPTFFNKNLEYNTITQKGMYNQESVNTIFLEDIEEDYLTRRQMIYMLNDLFGYILNVQQTSPISDQEKEKEDIQTGQDFEKYMANLLIKLGYENVELTRSTGDFGVDILAEREKIKYAIQCKYYSSPVGNKAVQEVFTGKTYYNANIGIVVTNNTFTPAAEEQAKASGVILWDKDDLEKFEEQTNQ